MRCPTLADLPQPPEGKTGWPWTKETSTLPEYMSDGKLWPKVSVITPSYNQGFFIEETIRSILLQGYPNLEYIIIDGGSTDESIKIIHKYETWITHWESEPDNGQSDAINKGFKMASGEIIAWLNSDDLYCSGSLSIAAQSFSKTPYATAVYGDMDIIDENSNKISHKKYRKFSLKELYNLNVIGQPATFIRYDALKQIGFLNNSLHFTMDYDLWLRLAQEVGKLCFIPQKMALFRWHNCSKSISQREEFYPEIIYILDRCLRNYDLDRTLTDDIYSQLLKLLIFIQFPQKTAQPYGNHNQEHLFNDKTEIYNLQPIKNILDSLVKDQFIMSDVNCLQKSLDDFYNALDIEYYYGAIPVPSPDNRLNWVRKQLIAIPDYLFSLGEKKKSLELYIKILLMRPLIFRYFQTYKFFTRYIVRSYIIPLRGFKS